MYFCKGNVTLTERQGHLFVSQTKKNIIKALFAEQKYTNIFKGNHEYSSWSNL